jgi:hypothetical protein
VAARLGRIRWPGELFEVALPVKDLAELHADDPDRFKERLAEARDAATPVALPEPASGGKGRTGCARPAEDGADDPRRKIRVNDRESRVNAEAAAALGKLPDVYQRGGELVRALSPDGPDRPCRIKTMGQAMIRDRLSAAARFIVRRGEDDVPIHPPAWCVAALEALGDWHDVRRLDGVTDTPVLLPDGSLLTQPGYHPGSRLLLRPTGPLPSLAAAPGHADAVRACDELLDVVSDFPFASAADRSAWLAALLTPLARSAFHGPAPLFLVDANVRSAGKGLLSQVIGRIVTGWSVPASAYDHDTAETRKLITSLVKEGVRLALLDNIVGPFGNAALDALLTATEWTDRLLGSNRTGRWPLLTVWYASANNAQPTADVTRRTCRIRLEHPDERPEERSDFARPDLLGWVSAARPRLLAAALTILAAYCAAGRPRQRMAAWGSFEAWSALVRGALVWIGQADPGEARLSRDAVADGDLEALGVLLSAWRLLDPCSAGLTCAEFLARLEQDPAGWPDGMPDHAETRAALAGLLHKPDVRSLGTRLRGVRNRNLGGWRFEAVSTRQRVTRWAARPATPFGGDREHTHHTHQDGSERCDVPDACNMPQDHAARGDASDRDQRTAGGRAQLIGECGECVPGRQPGVDDNAGPPTDERGDAWEPETGPRAPDDV